VQSEKRVVRPAEKKKKIKGELGLSSRGGTERGGREGMKTKSGRPRTNLRESTEGWWEMNGSRGKKWPG